MRILRVNATDRGGGADAVALRLHRSTLEAGEDAWLAVGRRLTDESRVLDLSVQEGRGAVRRGALRLASLLESIEGCIRGAWRMKTLLRAWEAGGVRKARDLLLGREDFEAPASLRLPDIHGAPPDLLHFHTLQGGYLDLRRLPEWSRRFPVFVTLHDAWLASGHCAHPLACERWRTGCGECPDLLLPPAVWRDATAYNWGLKRDILSRCRLHAATPSRWLAERMEASIARPGLVEVRVVPHGVDLGIYSPGDREAARRRLDLPLDARVVLSVGTDVIGSPWRDFALLAAAVREAGEAAVPSRLVLVCLGREAPPMRFGRVEARFLGYRASEPEVAEVCRASDVLAHPSRADSSSLAIIEAAACGIPHVGTAVGGIPELVEEGVTGFTTPPGDARAFAAALTRILRDPPAAAAMGRAARERAVRLHDLRRERDAYLTWYREVLASGARYDRDR